VKVGGATGGGCCYSYKVLVFSCFKVDRVMIRFSNQVKRNKLANGRL